MSKALRTVGTVLGTVALVAGVVATASLGSPAFAAAMGKVAAIASAGATPLSIPSSVFAKGPNHYESPIESDRHDSRCRRAGGGDDRHGGTWNPGADRSGRQGGSDCLDYGNTAKFTGWPVGARTGGRAA